MTINNIRRCSSRVVLALIIGSQSVSFIWAAEQVLSRGLNGEALAIADLATKENGEISGVLVNKSSRLLRDVQLLVRHTWHWKNEFRPQEDTLSRAVYHTLEQEIPPQGRASLHYKPSEPLPSRPDGHFETSVAIAGFTEVIR